MDIFLSIVVGVVIFGVMLVLVLWQGSKSKQLIEEWAREKQFKLIRVQERSFWKGPFFWTTNARKQVVYFVVVEDREGRERRGWIRCGGKAMGVFSDHFEVRWAKK